MTPLERQIIDFAEEHLRRDLPSRVKKLGEELGELAEALLNEDYAAAQMECADCGIVLTDIAHLLGPLAAKTPQDTDRSLHELMREKLGVVMERVNTGNWPRQSERRAA